MKKLMNDKERLLKIYFKLLFLSYFISAGMILSIFSEGFAWFLVGGVILGLFWTGLQFYVAQKANMLINDKNYIGLFIAYLLNTFVTVSLFFPVGIFGFYVLLHPGTHELFPADRNPQWVNGFFVWWKNILGDLRSGLTEKKSA